MTLAESAPVRGTALALVLALVVGGAFAAVGAPVFHHRHRHGHYRHGHGDRHGHPSRLGPRGLCVRGNTVVVPRSAR